MRSHADGFTLIEVMISLTIMAAVTALAYTGLSIGINSWERGTRQVNALDERSTVERLLSRQLALADPSETRAKIEDKPVVLFRGTSNRIDFVSNYSLADGSCDFRKIGYLFDGRTFRYEEKSLFGYVLSKDEQIQGRAVATLREMRFRFLKKGKDANSWQGDWNYGEGLPAAVEIAIEGDVILVPLVNGL
jgi:prepilin-type N-terminal cleavage/methylation domain-containing protein